MKTALSTLILALFNIAIFAQQTALPPNPSWIEFTYDAVGNRTQRAFHLVISNARYFNSDTTQTPPDSITTLAGRTQEIDHVNNLAQQNPDHISNSTHSKTETVVESSSGNMGKTQNLSNNAITGNGIKTPNSEHQTPNTEYPNTTYPSSPKTYTETLALGQSISIYPNPTKGALQLSFTGVTELETVSLQLFDLQGKKVYNKQGISDKEEINFTASPAGVYILKILVGGKKKEWTVVKE